MAGTSLPGEKLRDYLGTLTPQARALLIAALEGGLLRGEEMPGCDLVLQELRRVARDACQRTPRIGDPARCFFKAIAPFVVDDAPERKHPGRIARVTLEPIWTWIVLAEVERLVGELKADLKSGRGVAVIALLKSIHDAARGLRTELDLSVDSPWGRQLATIRTEISDLVALHRNAERTGAAAKAS